MIKKLDTASAPASVHRDGALAMAELRVI